MKPFHIHRFKIKDIFLEQPVLDVYGNHMTFTERPLYYDYVVKKCKCGKEKKVLEFNKMYSGTRAFVAIGNGLHAYRIVGKTPVL